MSGSGSVIRFMRIGARSRTGKWILQRCGGGTRRRRSGAAVRDGEEPPAGCCSRGVNRVKSRDTSTLGLPRLGLTTVVRCVVPSTVRRGGLDVRRDP